MAKFDNPGGFDGEGQRRAAQAFERTMLFDTMSEDQRQRRIADFRMMTRGSAEYEGAADFFEGAMAHERANQEHAGFLGFVGVEAEKEGKDPSGLTGDEFRAMFERFPGREQLEHREAETLALYRKAVDSRFSLDRVGRDDARILALDLLYRRAVRASGSDRRERLDELNEALKDLDEAIYLGAGSGQKEQQLAAGKRAEVRTMYLVRKWALEKGREHVVSIEHTLPRDDHARGIDFTLTIGDRSFSIDQKAFASDEYQQEFQDQKLRAASEKAARVGGAVARVDSRLVRETFDREKRGEKVTVRDRRKALSGIGGAIRDERYREALEAALFGEKKKGAPSRVTPQFLNKAVDVATLRRFGVLEGVDVRDVGALLEVKRRFIEAAKKVLKDRDELADPSEDAIESIKEALG